MRQNKIVMTVQKEELLKNIQSFINADNDLAIKEAEHQIKIFGAIYDKEITAFNEIERKEDNSEEETISPEQIDINKEILKAIENFKTNQEKKKNAKLKSEDENLKAKNAILKKFEELVTNKEKLSELAGGIKEIRAEWNSIGDISQKHQQKIQKQFSKLNEDFNYNFNIYKELKENDLKRNFSLKNQVIHKIKALEELKDVNKLKIELKILQNKWEEIGPTFKEHWEELKKSYWDLVHLYQKKINEHYSTLKANLKENLELKKALINKAEELSKSEPNGIKEYESVAQKFKSLQEEWKTVGPVAKKNSDKVWKEFRSHFDEFFEKRGNFMSIEKKKWQEKAKAKQALIDKAKQYVENVSEDGNPSLIKNLQEEWKKIGHAGKYAEQKLWRKFRQQCDAFFEKKNAHKTAAISLENENLKTKQDLIQKFNKQKEVSFENVTRFVDEFQKTGEVPRKSSLKIMGDFEKIIQKIISNSGFTSEQQHQLQKAIKSSMLSNSSDPDKVFMDEKNRINKLINSALKETAQLENNLGFFANAKGSKMLDEFQGKIDHQKKQIEDWREELKKLREAYRQK